MVKIRLKRQGRKKRPFYRIVVTSIRNRRDGAPIEELGYYNPLSKELKLDKAKANEWIAKGAQPSDTAKRLIEKASDTGDVIILEVAKKERLSKKAAAKKEADAAAAAEKAAAPAEEKQEEPAKEEEAKEEAPAADEKADDAKEEPAADA